MKYKHEVFTIFKDFKNLVENKFSTRIKSFQSDSGGEYTKRDFQKIFLQHGIQFRSSCPAHPEQNGLAERKHRQIVDTGLTMLAHSFMPIKYWDCAFETAIYLINRLPTKTLHLEIPFTKIFHTKPKFDFLRTFGCACFPCLRPYNSNKLQFRSKLCVFLGYSLNHHGYRCLDRSTGRIYLSRHVVFDEGQFPFKETQKSSPPLPSHIEFVIDSTLFPCVSEKSSDSPDLSSPSTYSLLPPLPNPIFPPHILSPDPTFTPPINASSSHRVDAFSTLLSPRECGNCSPRESPTHLPAPHTTSLDPILSPRGLSSPRPSNACVTLPLTSVPHTTCAPSIPLLSTTSHPTSASPRQL